MFIKILHFINQGFRWYLAVALMLGLGLIWTVLYILGIGYDAIVGKRKC